MIRKSYADYILNDDLQPEKFSRKIKIAVLRNYTVELLLPVLKSEIAKNGVYPEIFLGDFDTILQDLLSDNSQLHQFQPEFVCLFLDLRIISPKLSYQLPILTEKEIEFELQHVIDHYKQILTLIHEKFSATVICHNFIGMNYPSRGILDTQMNYSELEIITRLNHEIHDLNLQFESNYLLDLFSLTHRLGFQNVFDSKSWNKSKNPFTKQALVEIGIEFGKFFEVFLGKIRKCLVLDCDNTLWGGIVGEDGINGLQLGDDYPGVCFQHFQQEILNLYSRGILLTLCSKNNEQDVLDVFEHNSNMILKLKHFVTWQINWDSKADNIRKIAAQLNIGLDSLVFVDDSPFECNLIRDQLPEVEVIELSKNPSQHSEQLRSSGFFNALTITNDDLIRSENYRADRNRIESKKNFKSIDEYLQSLNMSAKIFVNNPENISRIAQMTQKTNQFNLTTKRYTESQISEFVNRKDVDVIAISLKDNFSDLGIIAAAIVIYQDVALIDEFLLSCRALGRKVEELLFSKIVQLSKDRGIDIIEGLYIPTKKNSQTADLYSRFGFDFVENIDDSKKFRGKSIFKFNNEVIFYESN